MKIISWNVNGIRAVERKGFLDWFSKEDADIVCLQEIKATPDQLSLFLLKPQGYQAYWHPAQKPGYSGVSFYSKQEPLSLSYGIGIPEIDIEGRVIVAKFTGLTVVNAYFPSTQRVNERLGYKLFFCREILSFCKRLQSSGQNIVLCGDFNIAHREIDLRNPKANEKNGGYLPEERAWMDELTQAGYVDTFRHFVKDPHHYSWWSYRPGVREKNVGWRIDYHFVSAGLLKNLKGAGMNPEIRGSDHCPVWVDLQPAS